MESEKRGRDGPQIGMGWRKGLWERFFFFFNDFFILLMLKAITKYCHEGGGLSSQIPRNRGHSPATQGHTGKHLCPLWGGGSQLENMGWSFYVVSVGKAAQGQRA